MRTLPNHFLTTLFVATLTLSFVPAGPVQLFAQDHSHMHMSVADSASSKASPALPPAEFVALDECDPATFNAVLGPDFCKNVALGYATTLSDLLTGAQSNNPSPNWDFEPDSVSVPHGTLIKVVDQGGEPHTFTEVQKFGGGFIAPLNAPGETTVPECVGGFSTVAVAKTRIIQGSTIELPNLSKGVHLFQCCIHPWMHVTVDVK